jgi:hypothetical protein
MISKLLTYALLLFIIGSTNAIASTNVHCNNQVVVEKTDYASSNFSKGKKKKNGRYKKKKGGIFKRLFKKNECDCPKH